MKDFEIVLASYKEPMDWMTFLPEKDKRKYQLTVSNSGGLTNHPAADRTLKIPNGGREAGHYLNFIVENYDNLLPVTVFLQADPWPHSAPYVAQLLELFFGAPTFNGPISYLGRNYEAMGLEPMKDSPLDKILTECWGGPYPKGIGFTIGAQFFVTREVILAMPKEYYEKLLVISRDQSFSFAHLVEGHWGNVFKHQP